MRRIKKKLIGVWLPEDLIKELKNLVKAKYPGIRGLSWEVEEALRNWIALHRTHTKAQTTMQINTLPKIQRIYEEVKNYLRQQGYEIQVTLIKLKEAIGIVRGTDPRTIRKWLKTFKKYRLIREIAPQIWQLE